ncbi:MAG TPA: hypothetical protein VK856_01135 [Anaerolineaceae bacterium]|nr:hypothetical protein [Anaerolineaceae bacterium]
MEKKCIVCEISNQRAPLIQLDYQNQSLYICPTHLPVLIHHPEELIGKMDGAEEFKAG